MSQEMRYEDFQEYAKSYNVIPVSPSPSIFMASLRQLAAWAGVIISVTNAVHFPDNIRGILLAISGTILAVEHAVDGITNPATVTPGAAPASTGQVQAGAASGMALSGPAHIYLIR